MMSKQFLQNTRHAILIVVILLIAIPVLAQGSTPTDDEVNKIAKQLYCPVCENTPLDVCPTEACRQWREEIRTMLAAGKSEVEIKDYFVNYYGARVLNEPPNRLVTYLVPTIAILLGALLLFRGFQMWLKPVGTETASGEADAKRKAGPVQQDEYIARLEEELQKRK